MSTHNKRGLTRYENFTKISLNYFLSYWKNLLEIKNEFESATVNEPSVFVSLNLTEFCLY